MPRHLQRQTGFNNIRSLSNNLKTSKVWTVYVKLWKQVTAKQDCHLQWSSLSFDREVDLSDKHKSSIWLASQKCTAKQSKAKNTPKKYYTQRREKSLNQESTGKTTFTERNEQERARQESSPPAQGTKPAISRGGADLATQPKTTRINKHLSVVTYYRLSQITNKEMQTYWLG